MNRRRPVGTQLAGHRLARRVGTAAAGLILPLSAAQAQAPVPEPPPIDFALPAQPLGDALRAVALQSGRNLLVADQLVAGRAALPLAGRLAPEQAITRLLAGTGLRWRLVDDAIIVEAAAPSPHPVQPDAAEDAQTIVVTGTSLRGAQPTSPVIAIGRREIDRAAPASVEELFRKLPQNVASGVGQENFGVTGAGSDITEHGAGVNLRGLGQRATLTLVNGRRLAPSGTGSFVDVSLLPISAIERIEIVTDGASAIYGSDAVGGVVNFLLRRNFSGVEATVQAGSATKGDGDQFLLGLAAGRHWGGGRALLAYEFRLEDEITAGDRPFTIGLPESWSLLPRERRHSLFGDFSQELASGVTLDLSGFFARRRTDRSYFQGAGILAVDAAARARATGGTAALTWSPGGNWEVESSASRSQTRNHQVQREAEGAGLVNRLDTRNRVTEFGLKLTGDLWTLPGGTAKLAVGGQLRRERYRDLFETPVNLPNPVAERRTVRSLYGEVQLPLVGAGNRRLGVDRLLITGAVRLEDYSTFGSSVDPKLGLLWSPGGGLDLRASYATSFRAPLLSESAGYYNAFLFPAALLYLQPATAPAGVGAVLIGADPEVEPETSRSWTVGGDWRPPRVPGLALGVTYYDIRFANRIALPTQQIVVVGDPALESIISRSPDVGLTSTLLAGAGQLLDFSGPGFTDGGATPGDVVVILDARTSNTAATRTRGLDLIGRYGFEVGADNFRFDLNLNRVLAFTDRLTPTSAAIETLNRPFGPLKWRGRAGLGWTHGGASANLFVNYAGAYRDRRGGRNQPVGSFTTLDFGLAYDLDSVARRGPARLRLALNAQNLLDKHPPRLEPEPGFSRDVGFDPVNATGRGRVVSLQLRAGW